MKQTMHFVREALLIVFAINFLGNMATYAYASSSDWRTEYKAMVLAYNNNDYDKATNFAKSALDKLVTVGDQTEKNIALDEILRQLQSINCRYEQKQNYVQQETVLRSILRAQQAKTDDGASYQVDYAKKRLATCLVLEGKTKEAEKYLSKSNSLVQDKVAAAGWKRDLDLLTQCNKPGYSRSLTTDDKENICKYAKKAVDEACSVKNATEQDVAFNQILQQLQTAQYTFKNNKDYANEETVLKLTLKIDQVQEAQKAQEAIKTQTTQNPFVGAFQNYQGTATLKELVTCLVMQGKNDEAAKYDTQYKDRTEKSMKQMNEWQKNLQDQLGKVQTQPTKGKDSI